MTNKIKNPGTEQRLHENLSWERTLDFCLQENAFMKTRLAEVLEDVSDKDMITMAEYFHNSFIHNDDSIKELKGDIVWEQRKMKEIIQDGKPEENSLVQRHRKLSNEMGNFDKNFTGLKAEFNRYLSSLLKL
ncbi:MAG: hypothetical protein U0T68_03935 [Ferruginibacter sp.]